MEFYALHSSFYMSPSTLIAQIVLPTSYTTGHKVSMSRDGKYVAVGHTGHSNVYVYERKPCHSSCATCSGPNSDQCTSCVIGTLSGSTCPTACSNNCGLCKLGSTTECISCDQSSPNKYLMSTSKQCVYCDQPGQVIRGLDCLPCGSNCDTCSSAAPNQCITCLSGYVRTGILTYIACGPNCHACSQDITTSCTSCKTLYNLYPDNTCGTCNTNNGQYLDSSQICRSCISNCLRCDIISLGDCQACQSNFCLNVTDSTCRLKSIEGLTF